jgi:hypothetical protein
MDLGLNGKVGAMTGGSVGVGLAIAVRLVAEGLNRASADSDYVVAQTLNVDGGNWMS